MPDVKTKDNRPYWIWSVPRSVLPLSAKHFYCYFAWFGKHANHEWNCRLALRFHVSRSTIKSWLRQLKKLRLVWITSGGGKHRRIHCRHYKSMLDWLTNLALPNPTLQYLIDRKKRSKKDFNLNRQRQIRALLAFSPLTGQKNDHNIL